MNRRSLLKGFVVAGASSLLGVIRKRVAQAEVNRRRLTSLDPLDRFRRDPSRFLSEAEKPPDPWQVDVLRGDSARTMLLCCRQSGKSTVSAALALKAALLSPGSLVLLLSPTLRQSGELFRDKVLRLYNALNRPVPTVQESQLQVTFANGSRVISLPGDEETIRGYSGVSLLVIDEAARVEDSLYYAVRPMLAVSGGRLVALSTPFGKRGWFHDEWHGSGPWQRVMVTAAECPRIPADFLAEERRSMGRDWYAQEYLCEFREGGGTPLFPAEWLEASARQAKALTRKRLQGRGIGVDPAEGGDRSVWVVVDDYGVLDLLSLSTPDTSVIPGQTVALMRRWNVAPDRVAFDRGGGGKEHADRLRQQGYPVRTVAFGEAATIEPTPFAAPFARKAGAREERYAYRNRRAQMYHGLRLRLDPSRGEPFAIPSELTELRRQLAPMPLRYDGEGRVFLPPKHKKDPDSQEKCLVDLIGCSPDEADGLALACFAMDHRPLTVEVGVL